MKPSLRERYIAIHLRVTTFAARCLGILALICAAVGLFSFALSPEHALGDLIFGILFLVVGIALLWAKRLEPADLHKI
jgi:uncharacterized membrane protein YfcA